MIMLAILAMQMFPSTVLLIALYVVFRETHLLNTYTALILSFITHGLPFSIWMMRGCCYFIGGRTLCTTIGRRHSNAACVIKSGGLKNA